MLNKEQKKRILAFLAPTLGVWLLRFIFFTCKVKIHGNKLPNSPCILATWHREILLMPFCYNSVKNKKQNVSVIASPHGDGQLVGRIIKKLTNGKTIDGSSSKHALKALLEAIKVLKEGFFHVAIAPDGPRGPIYSVAGGVVMLSQKANVPIVAFNCKASKAWEFNSWDKMFLPKPFSKVDFYIGEPFLLTHLSVEEGKQKVKERLSGHVTF